MSDAELEAKFLECAEWGGLGRERAQRVVELVNGLESLDDVRTLTSLLGQTAVR